MAEARLVTAEVSAPPRGRTTTAPVNGLGADAQRPDGVPKVRGEFAFSSDLWADGMLWGRTLRSPHPAARIVSIDTSLAERMPGVGAVVTAEDVPGARTYGLEHADQPVFASEVVRYQGEAVAAVAATHPEIAARALDAIEVVYEVDEPLVDPEQAIDGPPVHPEGNLLRHVPIRFGDAGASGDVVVEGAYEVGMQDQAFMGPESGMAIPADDGGVDLYIATQWLHVDRDQVAACLGLEPERVRLTLAGVGGAFGAREDVSLQVHVCMLALRTGKPVKMVYSREESFYGHVHRHPARMQYRHHASRDGELVKVEARILLDGGAYASSSTAVVANAACFAPGPYRVPNAVVDGYVVRTNNPPCGAMRGFGAVQVCFAHEAQMDRLADALGMDPVELRLRNALRTGDRLITGQPITGTAPVREVIEAAVAHPLPAPAGDDPLLRPGGAGLTADPEHVRRGVGVAVGFKNLLYSEGFDDHSTASVRLELGPDGDPFATVHIAVAEVGQGFVTLAGQIARSELGVERVVLRQAATDIASAGSTSASRQTWISGGAVQAACRAVRARVAERLGAAPAATDPAADEPDASTSPARDRTRGGPPGMRGESWDPSESGGDPGPQSPGLAGDADAPPDTDELRAALADGPIEETAQYRPARTHPLDADGQGHAHVSFAFAAHRAVVDVDPDLGLCRVVHIATGQDVGRALNPVQVTGQIEGGIAQGLGLAVMEEILLDDGRISNPSFTDYLIPTALDMPPVAATLVEQPEPGAPFGAKGVGEPPTISSTPAVVAALRDATGLELSRVPVRPPDIALARDATTGDADGAPGG